MAQSPESQLTKIRHDAAGCHPAIGRPFSFASPTFVGFAFNMFKKQHIFGGLSRELLEKIKIQQYDENRL